jgi:ribosome modulation factor
LVLGAICPALADEKPGDCLGVDFDAPHPIAIGKIVTDKPRVNFIKSAWEDAACPADSDACSAQAYLVPGDLVLLGKKNGAYTCASYQSAEDRTQRWTNGWLLAVSLAPVTPVPSPARSDWIGGWVRAGGEIDITEAGDGRLKIHGEAIYRAAQDVHNGVIDATAKPAQGVVAFADDGKVAFDKAGADSCVVRMQRVEALLVAEDNGNCGGVDVTFAGFYRRKE